MGVIVYLLCNGRITASPDSTESPNSSIDSQSTISMPYIYNCGLTSFLTTLQLVKPEHEITITDSNKLLREKGIFWSYSLADIGAALQAESLNVLPLKLDSPKEIFAVLRMGKERVGVAHLTLPGRNSHFIVLKENNDGTVAVYDFPQKRRVFTQDEFLHVFSGVLSGYILDASVNALDMPGSVRSVGEVHSINQETDTGLTSNRVEFKNAVPVSAEVDNAQLLIGYIDIDKGKAKNISDLNVKGSCSCFSGYRMIPESPQADNKVRVEISFKRSLFDDLNGTQVAATFKLDGNEHLELYKIYRDRSRERSIAYAVPSKICCGTLGGWPKEKTVVLYIPCETLIGGAIGPIVAEDPQFHLKILRTTKMSVIDRDFICVDVMIQMNAKPGDSSQVIINIPNQRRELKLPIEYFSQV